VVNWGQDAAFVIDEKKQTLAMQGFELAPGVGLEPTTR
jgi:hypothetical protein